MQYLSTNGISLKVKNTFLDGWDDEEEALEHARQSRFRTCSAILQQMQDPETGVSIAPDRALESTQNEGQWSSPCTTPRFQPGAFVDTWDGSCATPRFQPEAFADAWDRPWHHVLNADTSGSEMPQKIQISLASQQFENPIQDSRLELNLDSLLCPVQQSLQESLRLDQDVEAVEAHWMPTEVFAEAQLLPTSEVQPVEDVTAPSRHCARGGRTSRGSRKGCACSLEKAESALSSDFPCEEQLPANTSSRRRSTRGGARMANKLWVHLYLDETMLRPGFELNKKIIGHGGSCTRGIFEATGAKIRLRGRGSKHLELDGHREAPVHLMLAVTAEKLESDGFRRAFDMCVTLLRGVQQRFMAFCEKFGETAPTSPLFWVGEVSAEGQECLGSALADVHIMLHAKSNMQADRKNRKRR